MAGKQKEIKAITNKEDREKALNAALSQIQKEFGKGAVMKLGDECENEYRIHLHRFYELGFGDGYRRCSQRANNRSFRT